MAALYRSIVFWLSVAYALAASAAAGAEDAPVPATECGPERAVEIAARVQARYDAIKDLSARFEQLSESVVLSGASLGGEEPSRGDVVFAKPGRMRWSYVEPEPSLVVSDGKTMWIYDEAAQQATRLPVQQDYLAGAALQFLLGEGRIDESFFLEALACTPQTVELQLLPKQPASYEKLGLTAEVASGLVVETTIVDLFGNRTRIRFADVKLDQAPPAATFQFAVPKGVEVIDLELRSPGAGGR